MERIFKQLLKIANYYTDKRLYNYFIDKYNLSNIKDVEKFFNNIFNFDNLLEYLFDIKEQIAVRFILQNNIDDADITDFAYNIYNFFKSNSILLFLIQKNINANNYIIQKPKLFKQANNDIKEKIPNLDEYIIGILSHYFISPEFIEYILKQDYVKSMRDIYNIFNNLDIKLIKEYLELFEPQKIQDELIKDIHQPININLYEYIFNNANIIKELIQRIQYNFIKIIYREFFEQGKYLNKLTQASDLANIDDTKKQQTYIIRTDVNNRDKAFMDIDRHILLSPPGGIHKDLFNQYVEKKYNIKFNNGKKRRPKKENVLSKTNIKSWAYGHISNNVYIIDGVNNITIDEVVDDLKKYGITDKIYSFEYINNQVYYGLATREAKKVSSY